MRKLSVLVLATALFSIQPVLADETSMAGQGDQGSNRPCGMIAKACLSAGYTRGDGPQDKFFHGCMKPLLMGKTVSGVNVDAATVKSCRTDKIEEMKKELKEFQGVS